MKKLANNNPVRKKCAYYGPYCRNLRNEGNFNSAFNTKLETRPGLGCFLDVYPPKKRSMTRRWLSSPLTIALSSSERRKFVNLWISI